MYQLCARLFELKKKMEKISNFTHVIVAVYFDSFFVYRNTCRPCYVSKKAFKLSVPGFIC